MDGNHHMDPSHNLPGERRTGQLRGEWALRMGRRIASWLNLNQGE